MKKFNLKGFKLDLRDFFEVEGDKIIRAYKGLLRKKRGIAQDDAPSNEPSTVKRKGFNHWMKDTGKTISRGFQKLVPSKTKLIVQASPLKHPKRSDVSYHDIFDLHNKVDKKTGKSYSGVFGQLPVGSRTIQRMNKEMIKQVDKHILKNTPKRIKIKVK